MYIVLDSYREIEETKYTPTPIGNGQYVLLIVNTEASLYKAHIRYTADQIREEKALLFSEDGDYIGGFIPSVSALEDGRQLVIGRDYDVMDVADFSDTAEIYTYTKASKVILTTLINYTSSDRANVLKVTVI